jgi:thioredoxin 1
MSRKKGVQVVFPLADDAAFQKAVEESAKFLTVIDIHQNWCGPCTIMEPIYKKFYIELDRPEERLKFFTVDVDFLSPKSREGLPITEACKPLFVLYKVRCFPQWMCTDFWPRIYSSSSSFGGCPSALFSRFFLLLFFASPLGREEEGGLHSHLPIIVHLHPPITPLAE